MKVVFVVDGIGYLIFFCLFFCAAWDYLGGLYPTDAYGSTYIPTVQKPSGIHIYY